MTERWISMHDFLRALEREATDYFAGEGRGRELDDLSRVPDQATERPIEGWRDGVRVTPRKAAGQRRLSP